MKYKTKQREFILDMLKHNPGMHFTVKELCDKSERGGKKIGKTTIYRQLAALVDEGLVLEHRMGSGESVCFEYHGEDSCCDAETFHAKCERCGAVIHLECSELAAAGSHIGSHHHFYIDPRRTVFYGLCDECTCEGESEER